MDYSVLLYYKYAKVEDPEALRAEQYEFCREHDIKGRIFIAEEGINGTISALRETAEMYKAGLRNVPGFEDIIFKEDEAPEHAFRKLYVRVKQEIVNSGLDYIAPGQGSRRLKPEDLKAFYEKGRDFIIVDVRNYYESSIGHFRNALTPQMENFRQWPEIVEKLKEFKDKTIITYCTGGIRCEKASAYLASRGFRDVYQLEGGIVSYVKKYPDTFWEGSVFVFDERRSLEVNTLPELKHTGRCYYCGSPTSYYINCHNQDCDQIIISCHECKKANDYCCSEECRRAPHKRKRYHG